jgi:hypothetical protein
MSSTCIDYHITDSASFPFLETLSSPFQSIVGRADTDYSLISYFFCHFLSSLIHGHAHPWYHDFRYKCGMALEHRPLMDAALGRAVVPLARKVSVDPNAQSRTRKRALAYYSSRAQVPNVAATVKHVVSLSTLPRRQWLQKVVGNARWTGRRADDGVHSPDGWVIDQGEHARCWRCSRLQEPRIVLNGSAFLSGGAEFSRMWNDLLSIQNSR